MKLLFDNNLSPRLAMRLADMFASSSHVSFHGQEKGMETSLLSLNEIAEPALLIRIPRMYQAEMPAEQLYDATRGVWKVANPKRDRVRFALAIAGGIIREVYEVHSWHPANSTPYRSGRNIEMPLYEGRWEFIGKVAVDIREKYVGRSIRFPAGAANPVIYANVG